MVQVGGVPIIEHHLRWLQANGIERAILLTGYLSNVIADYFAQPRLESLLVECIAETQPLGRGGAFKNGYMQTNLTDDLVVATNGDVLTNQPLDELLAVHQSTKALATIMLAPMISPFGIVETDGSLVTAFSEKPALPYQINGGVYLLSREAIERFPELGDHETESFPSMASEGRLAGMKSSGFWKSIESRKDIIEGEQLLATYPLNAANR